MRKKVYLDNAATTPLDGEVLNAMLPYLTDHFGNPSSTHQFGRKTKTAIENARRSIAFLLNASPREICFTSGGTEADNMAITAAVVDLGCERIITAAIEHSAVIKTSERVSEEFNVPVEYVNLLEDGHVDLVHLRELLERPGKAVVSLMHGNNEIANLLPLQEVSELCAEFQAIFHSDTVQTMGHYEFDLEELGIHFITGSAHKFHGPKGIGFLYVDKKLKISPLIRGGGQERQMRGGTENLYGIVGMAKAMEIAFREVEEHKAHIWGLKSHVISRLQNEMDGIEFNGDCASENSLYTVLNVTLPENPNSAMLLFLMDLEGIAVSGGSACSSGASKGSHVLDALDAIQPGKASLRLSFSRFSTTEEVDYAIDKLVALCKVKQLAPEHETEV